MNDLNLKLIHQEKIKPISTVTGTASSGTWITFNVAVPPPPVAPVPVVHPASVPAAHPAK
jgi:hypothetical protein